MGDGSQKIKCTVQSCKYNNCTCNQCQLNQIHVKACPNCSSGNPEDESMCGNYTKN